MTGYNKKKICKRTNKQTNKQNGHFLQLNLRMATKSVSFNKVKLPNCYELITNKH